MKDLISVVVPVYKCSATLQELVQRVFATATSSNCDCEIILVNDGCPANSWRTIQSIISQMPNQKILGINLSRNFGQHYAITAGLNHCSGSWVIVMDGDLQDIPEEIGNLYSKALEGFDVVLAKRKIRNDSFLKKLYSKMFYKVFNFLVDAKFDESVANFGIYSDTVISNFKRIEEKYRFFPLAISWLGFNQTSIVVNHGSREEGKSSYSFFKLLQLGVKVIVNQTNKPLYLAMAIGCVISILSTLLGIVFLYRATVYGTAVVGWASLMISVFFLSGTILFSIGLLGIYIGNIFSEVKSRPLYIIKETIGNAHNAHIIGRNDV